MKLLDKDIIKQLDGFFNKITDKITIYSFLDDSKKSNELDKFLLEIDSISKNINYKKQVFNENKELESKFNIKRPTSFTFLNKNKNSGINFYGIPGGHEFNSFILAILSFAKIGKPPEDSILEKINTLNKKLEVEIYVTLSCPKCPKVVQPLNTISLYNNNIKTSMIDIGIFSEEAKKYNIQGVPMVFVNGKLGFVGVKTFDELLDILSKY